MSRFAFVSALLLVPAAVQAQAPTAAAAPVATPAPAADKVRCHRSAETGNLAKVHKECHTIAEWRQLADSGNADARQMLDRVINSTPGGN